MAGAQVSVLARHNAGILLIHACVQDFNTKSNVPSVAFDEHAVAPEFTPEFTLTDEFTSALKFVSSVPMGDVHTPGPGEKVLAPPRVCLAPNGKGDRRLGLVEHVQRGKRRRKVPERVRLAKHHKRSWRQEEG